MPQPTPASSMNDESLKVAIAISLLRSKIVQKRQPPQTPSESDALRWKQKAKQRKQEILRLREDLKEAEDASHCDIYPPTASCKCYFFDNLGVLAGDSSHHRFDNVLRRRFLRLVRLKGRSGAAGSITKRRFSDINNEDETEQLKASVDFLIDICDNNAPVDDSKFTSWSHQAVDFIIESLKSLLSKGNSEPIEGIITCLITRLIRRMCYSFKEDESHFKNSDFAFVIQHLLRSLGCQPYIGQRALLSLSQKISEVAECLLFSDPFSDAFPLMHESMFLLFQLIEVFISDNLLTWATNAEFDQKFRTCFYELRSYGPIEAGDFAGLYEEWVASLLRAQKAVQVLESRNGLYALYMDRVTGVLAKLVCQSSSLQKLNSDILDHLFG